MKKSTILGLVIVMVLALFGLVLVQVKWIKGAFLVQEKQFDQLVRKAITEAVDAVERRAKHLMFDEMISKGMDSAIFVPPLKPYDTVVSYRVQQDGWQIQQDVYFKGQHSAASSPVHSSNDHPGINSNTPQNQIRQIPGATENVDLQQYLQRRMELIDYMLRSTYNYGPEISKKVSNQLLSEYLESSFENYGIDLSFEYAVLNRNVLTSFHSNGFDPKVSERLYRVRMFSSDFYFDTNYLSVYFPKRTKFIINSIGLLGVISGLLILMILFVFAFTLYVIFRQKRLSEMKNDFVSNMTHELKTPISTISLASQMLGDTNIPAERKNLNRIADIISEESKRLGYQVEKVLQAAVFNQAKLKLKRKPTHFNDVVESVMTNFAIQVEAKGGLLIPSLHAEKDKVNIDKVHMTNVLSNLLDNALKYCDKRPEIYVETNNRNGSFILSVRDNGMGISKSNQKRIFDRFYRVSTGNVHNIKGFGLGLSYVKRIVDEHKGNITIESELGKGSVFRIEIPLLPDQNIE